MNKTLLKKQVHRILNWSLPFLIICVCGLMACESKKRTEEDREAVESEKVAALRKEVIAVHDEVMPLMTDIYQLKTKLKERLQTGEFSGATRQHVDSVLVQLDSADHGMRAWMRSFSKVETTGIPETEALDKLNAELEKIRKVKDDMVGSVQAAKAID